METRARVGVGGESRAAPGEGVGWMRRRRWRVWRARREEERAAAMEAGDRIEIGFAAAGTKVRRGNEWAASWTKQRLVASFRRFFWSCFDWYGVASEVSI